MTTTTNSDPVPSNSNPPPDPAAADDALVHALEEVVLELDPATAHTASTPDEPSPLCYGRSSEWWLREGQRRTPEHLRTSALGLRRRGTTAPWRARRRAGALAVSVAIHASLAAGAGWIVLSPAPRDARDLGAGGDATLGISDLSPGAVVLLDDQSTPDPAAPPSPDNPAEPEPAPNPLADALRPDAAPLTEIAQDHALSRAREPEPTARASNPPAPAAHAEPVDLSALQRSLQARRAAESVIPPTASWAQGRMPARTRTPASGPDHGASSPSASGNTHDRARGTNTSPHGPGRAEGADSRLPGLSGPGVVFAGAGAAGAESIVYAVDASGPMVTSLPIVLDELRRSIAALSEQQRFSVVLFRGGGEGVSAGAGGEARSELFSPELLAATSENKAALDRWLGQAQPGGSSNPLVGLELALEMRPQIVFLFSRSLERSGGGVWGQGLWVTLDRLERLNPPIAGLSGQASDEPMTDDQLAQAPRAVQIQTIAFLNDDPTGTMQAIARRHGPRPSPASAAEIVYSVPGYRVVKRSEDLAR